MHYDSFNREERALCFHLFRLLHEDLASNPSRSGLADFLSTLASKGLRFCNSNQILDLTSMLWGNIGIYPEVALVRDAYDCMKPSVAPFMNELTRLIAIQQGISDYTPYSKLPSELNDSRRTHPKQIGMKLRLCQSPVSEGDRSVYGTLQSVFNAKPDFAITLDQYLFVVEAKFTEGLDPVQLRRTRHIAQLWASDLISPFLGFRNNPSYVVVTLGPETQNPDVSWQELLESARHHFSKGDRSRVAMESAVALLQRINPRRSS